MESLKHIKSLWAINEDNSYSPDKPFRTTKFKELNENNLETMIKNILQGSKVNEGLPIDLIKEIESLMDKNGNIIKIMEIPNMSVLEKIFKKDKEYMFMREVSETELDFVLPLYKKSIKKEVFKLSTSKKKEESILDYAKFIKKKEVSKNEIQKVDFLGTRTNNPRYIDSNKNGTTQYFHSLLNETMLSMKKYYTDEITESNKSSFINLYEKPTIRKVLTGLSEAKYEPNRMTYELPKLAGFLTLKRKKKTVNPIKNLDVDGNISDKPTNKAHNNQREILSDFYDEFPLEFIKETWLFKFICHSYKLVNLYHVHSAMFS